MKPTTRFYERWCPKDRAENAAFRADLLKSAYRSRLVQRDIWRACRDDVLLYINAFGYLAEPRENVHTRGTARILPFVTFDYQDDAILQLQEHAGRKDVVIHKSRATGATWMCLYLADHQWRFHESVEIGFCSRTLDDVDSMDNKSSLMAKLDFIRGRLPDFLLPGDGDDKAFNRNTTRHTYVNYETNSIVVGDAPTANAFRGGRFTWILFDEFHFFDAGDDELVMASTQHAAGGRVFVSTPNKDRGESGSYWRMVHNEQVSRVRIDMDWKQDPHKAEGMYVFENGKLKFLDPRYKSEKAYRVFTDGETDYEFVRDGKYRSPYYDAECRKPDATPQMIAAELDRSFIGSSYNLFDDDSLAIAQRTIVSPTVEGQLGYDLEDFNSDWFAIPGGPWKLWFRPDARGLPPNRPYVFGVDVASGLGGTHSSYSAIQVLDRITGEQVAEFVDLHTKPEDLATLTVAAAKWFHDAYVVPEINGPVGQAFLQQFLATGYRNVYRRIKETKNYREQKEDVGYHSSDPKPLLVELRKTIRSGRTTVRSRRVIDELRQYQLEKGKVVHRLAKETGDVDGRGHGDAAIAYCLAWEGLRKSPIKPEDPPPEVVPVGSFAWRQQQARERERDERNAGKPSYWRGW